MKIKVQEIEPGLILARFKNQYLAAATFMRLAEFYESKTDHIREHVFALEQCMDAYASEHGNFTYTTDWQGFNIPGDTAREFFARFNDELLHKEAELYTAIEPYLSSQKPFYLVGTSKSNKVIRHEIAHGLWSLFPAYKAQMQELLTAVVPKYREKMNKWLAKSGYPEKVFEDETQAYFATDTRKEFVKAFGRKLGRQMFDDCAPFRRAFREFKSCSGSSSSC